MIKVDYKKQDMAVELPDGQVLNIPERTAELTEKLEVLENTKNERSEYEQYQAVLETLFGRSGFKKIAPKGKKENVDYIAAVYVACVKALFAEKERIQAEEIKRKLNRITPIVNKVGDVNSALKHSK